MIWGHGICRGRSPAVGFLSPRFLSGTGDLLQTALVDNLTPTQSASETGPGGLSTQAA